MKRSRDEEKQKKGQEDPNKIPHVEDDTPMRYLLMKDCAKPSSGTEEETGRILCFYNPAFEIERDYPEHDRLLNRKEQNILGTCLSEFEEKESVESLDIMRLKHVPQLGLFFTDGWDSLFPILKGLHICGGLFKRLPDFSTMSSLQNSLISITLNLYDIDDSIDQYYESIESMGSLTHLKRLCLLLEEDKIIIPTSLEKLGDIEEFYWIGNGSADSRQYPDPEEINFDVVKSFSKLRAINVKLRHAPNWLITRPDTKIGTLIPMP